MKRVFHIDIQTCRAYAGAVRIIACIEAPAVFETILTHLDRTGASSQARLLPETRAPPQVGLFDR